MATTPETTTTTKKQRALRLKMWWLLMCGVGEMAGLGAAFAVGAGSALALGVPDSGGARVAALALMVAAGALEGSVVGWFQGRVLSTLFKDFPRRRFMGATAAVAAFGWAVGVSTPLFAFEPGAASPLSTTSIGGTLAFVALLGALLGLLFGVAQSWATTGVTPNRRLWVFGNVVGWAAGLPFAALFPALLPDGAPLPVVVVTGGIGGLITGAWVAIATAPVVVHWALLDDGVVDDEDAAVAPAA